MIDLMIEAVRTSETSVYSNETARLYIPEDSTLHNSRRENLKSHTNLLGKKLFVKKNRVSTLSEIVIISKLSSQCWKLEALMQVSTTVIVS
jgi:hypothetical protein